MNVTHCQTVPMLSDVFSPADYLTEGVPLKLNIENMR